MQSFGRVVAVVVMLGIVALAGYGAYRFLLPHWQPILLYGYLALGLFILTLAVVRKLSELRDLTARERNWEVAGEAARRLDWKTRLNYIREQIVAFLTPVANVAVWPISFLIGIILAVKEGGRQFRLREMAARLTNTFIHNYISLYALLLVLGVLAMERYTHRVTFEETLLLYLLLANTTLRHASYAVSTVSLPAMLRRVTGKAYFAFLIIIATDFAILVLTLSANASPQGADGLTLAGLREASSTLLKAQEPLKLLRGGMLSGHQVITGIVGLFFYLALFKTLYNFREFRRTDEDYVAMALTACELGDFSVAMRHLRNVKSWNLEARSVKLMALLGVHQLDLAEREAEIILDERFATKTPEAITDSIWGASLLAPIPDAIKVEILERGIRHQVGDVFLLFAVYAIVGSRTLREKFEQAFLSVQEDYPLTLAFLQQDDGEYAASIQTLALVPLADPTQEIAQRILTLMAGMRDPTIDNAGKIHIFSEWADNNLPRIRSIITTINDSQQLTYAVFQIITLLPLARAMRSARTEEIRFLIDSLRVPEKLQPAQLHLLRIFEQQMEKA